MQSFFHSRCFGCTQGQYSIVVGCSLCKKISSLELSQEGFEVLADSQFTSLWISEALLRKFVRRRASFSKWVSKWLSGSASFSSWLIFMADINLSLS